MRKPEKKQPSKLFVDLCVDLALIAGLVCLFVFPANFIADVGDQLTEGARAAIEDVKAGEYAAAGERLESMQQVMREARETMKLFLNHDDIVALEASINGCKQLTIVKDHAQILVELESIVAKAEYLHSIEHFSVGTLL
ncbi:MAG: DUF4363 family protein [Bacillota bacterium]